MFDACPNVQVRQSIRWLYTGSALLFFATILLGFLNVFSPDAIPRAQVLAHLHSGSIGWVTLSVVATTLWAFTAGRDPGPGVVGFTQLVAGLGVVSVAGYIAAFGTAFGNTDLFWMLPLFGIPTWLVIVAVFVFTLHQKAHVTWTMPHLLLSSALLVAGLGATMGVLIGLSHAGVVQVFPEGADAVGSHAGPMDMYLALAFAAIIEALVARGGALTKWGQAQAVLGVISGFAASAALLFGVGPLIPLALLLFLAAFVIYFVRIGRHAFSDGFGDGIRLGRFFGAVFFPIYILFFVYLVAVYFSKGDFPPHGLLVAFTHVTFVGMATNLMLATHAAMSPARRSLRLGLWVMNIGLVLFAAESIADGGRFSALLMGLGVLMAWGAVVMGHAQALRTDAERS